MSDPRSVELHSCRHEEELIRAETLATEGHYAAAEEVARPDDLAPTSTPVVAGTPHSDNSQYRPASPPLASVEKPNPPTLKQVIGGLWTRATSFTNQILSARRGPIVETSVKPIPPVQPIRRIATVSSEPMMPVGSGAREYVANMASQEGDEATFQVEGYHDEEQQMSVPLAPEEQYTVVVRQKLNPKTKQESWTVVDVYSVAKQQSLNLSFETLDGTLRYQAPSSSSSDFIVLLTPTEPATQSAALKVKASPDADLLHGACALCSGSTGGSWVGESTNTPGYAYAYTTADQPDQDGLVGEHAAAFPEPAAASVSQPQAAALVDPEVQAGEASVTAASATIPANPGQSPHPKNLLPPSTAHGPEVKTSSTGYHYAVAGSEGPAPVSLELGLGIGEGIRANPLSQPTFLASVVLDDSLAGHRSAFGLNAEPSTNLGDSIPNHEIANAPQTTTQKTVPANPELATSAPGERVYSEGPAAESVGRMIEPQLGGSSSADMAVAQRDAALVHGVRNGDYQGVVQTPARPNVVLAVDRVDTRGIAQLVQDMDTELHGVHDRQGAGTGDGDNPGDQTENVKTMMAQLEADEVRDHPNLAEVFVIEVPLPTSAADVVV